MMPALPKRRRKRPPEPVGSVSVSPRLIQEARRILRRLTDPEAYIALLGETEAGIYVRRNGYRKPVLRVGRESLNAWISADLVALVPPRVQDPEAAKHASVPPRYVLNAAGRAFLARAAGGDAAFLAQHALLDTRALPNGSETSPTVVMVNLTETPLGWLVRRKDANGAPLITPEQYAAGERLREDYTRGQLMARVTMDWSRPMTSDSGGGRHETLSDSAMAARYRVNQALEAVGPGGLTDVLIEVCCHLRGLEETERLLHWPPRAGKIVIRIALERLADFYGLTARARARGGHVKSAARRGFARRRA